MFYDKYVELCQNAGKKPTPVAIELGFCSSNVAQWKKGSTPRPAALQKIADYFGVSQATLLELDTKEQKEKPDSQKEVRLDEKTRRAIIQNMTAEELAELIAECAAELKRMNSDAGQ